MTSVDEPRTLRRDAQRNRQRVLDAAQDRFLQAAILVHALDRLSRDQVDQEQVVRRLEHRGIRIVGVADGYDSSSGDSRFMLRSMRGEGVKGCASRSACVHCLWPHHADSPA